MDARQIEGERRRPTLPLATMLAIAMAIGIAIARASQGLCGSSPWPWLFASAALLLIATLTSVGAPAQHWLRRASPIFILLAMITFGGGWLLVQHEHAAPLDLAARIGDDAALVRVKGTALSRPTIRHRVGGALAKFDYREPATYFLLRVDGLITRTGQIEPASGKILVRLDQPVPEFRPGDRVTALGFLLRPQGPKNPGEFDYRDFAKSLGQAGVLTLKSRDALSITPVEYPSIYERFLDWRDDLRRRAGAWLLADLPQTASSERDSVLASLMLGVRDDQIDGVYSSFQRVGLAHVLAISGFHLGVLAGFVLLIARALTDRRRLQGLAVITFVVLYLLIVEARMPVLRAGVMTVLACAGLLISRRLHIGGLVSISGILLLLWRPDQLLNAGFQLSFGVVLALLYLQPHLRRRWFGKPDPEAATAGAIVMEWLKSAVATSIVAWLIALPIVMHHFGMISTWGIALSVLTFPLAAIILAVGFAKMAITAFLPTLAMLLGIPLSLCAQVLLALVITVDSESMPLSSINVPQPPLWWTFAAMACACWIMRGDAWLGKIRYFQSAWAAKWIMCGLLVIALLTPTHVSAALRIDMLSVGDGSCYVLRSGDTTVVVDAGSSTDLNVAQRSLIPAMRRLGVRGIDAIVITHPDMDHFSAIVELAEAFDVGELLITPQFQKEAIDQPLGAVAFMMEHASRMRIPIREMQQGAERVFGATSWQWLHPPADRRFNVANDASMVIRIAVGDRRVLLTGDIQREAVEWLMRSHADQTQCDVIELPHHGSYSDSAARFVRASGASVVLQSTGWPRWSRDRWGEALVGAERLVTARDGACWVEIAPDGEVKTGRFVHQKID